MNDQFQLQFEPIFRQYGTPIERATLAEISIVVDNVSLTRLEDYLAETVRRSARLSIFHLAHWFAANWWRLRWEPERSTFSWKMSHVLGSVGRGYVWPDVSFSSDGSTMLVHSRSTKKSKIHTIRYLESSDLVILVDSFEAEIDRFIEGVIARLVAQGAGSQVLTKLWSEVCEERRDPDLSSWRRMEAVLGFDPDEGPLDTITQLLNERQPQGPSAIEEIAASAMGGAPESLHLILQAEKEKLAQFSVKNLAVFGDRIRATEETTPIAYPWERAASLADLARSELGIKDGPISSEMLSEFFETPLSSISQFDSTPKLPISTGYRLDKDTSARYCISKKHPSARRFALARLIGDHLDSPAEERLLPATNARTARQKFQRAFAQEFLCPFAELEKFWDGEIPEDPMDEKIEDAADYFDVSPLVVTTTLVNKKLLGREALSA